MSELHITPEKRKRFMDAYSAWRHLNLGKIEWSKGKQLDNGSYTFGYPIYPDEVYEVMRAASSFLNGEGYAADAWRFDLAQVSLSDAVSYYAWLYRAERFSDGTISSAVDNGKFNQAAERILSLLPPEE
jgi:hypothetical protein